MEDSTNRKADDTTATVSRRLDDKSTTEDTNPMSSSDYPWQLASSQHFHPSIRTVPDSFAPPAFNGTNMDADTWSGTLSTLRRVSPAGRPRQNNNFSPVPEGFGDRLVRYIIRRIEERS